tara:strand:+ start:146 stop:394 length:249 start_codon:yes stop_codon:yes gene_type:complete
MRDKTVRYVEDFAGKEAELSLDDYVQATTFDAATGAAFLSFKNSGKIQKLEFGGGSAKVAGEIKDGVLDRKATALAAVSGIV